MTVTKTALRIAKKRRKARKTKRRIKRRIPKRRRTPIRTPTHNHGKDVIRTEIPSARSLLRDPEGERIATSRSAEKRRLLQVPGGRKAETRTASGESLSLAAGGDVRCRAVANLQGPMKHLEMC